MVSWGLGRRRMRRTVVVELVAPQDEGKEDGIQRPFLLDDEGADDQEARGDVYPVEILARKQGVGHVDGFLVGYWTVVFCFLNKPRIAVSAMIKGSFAARGGVYLCDNLSGFGR